jgi:acyl-CoA reductase-like NAD-dependent aldehyde dehydrogenase
VPVCKIEDLHNAVKAAKNAYPEWSKQTAEVSLLDDFVMIT